MTRSIRKFLSSIALLAVGCICCVASAVAAGKSGDELRVIQERIASEFEIIGPENVTPSPIEGWYMIQKGSIVAYVSEDAKYLLQGDLIDLEAQVNLTEHARDVGRRDMMAALGDDRVISFTPEDVKHSVTVFTDVGCTYCRRLHSQIGEYLAKGIEVRYVLYPRNGPGSPDWQESEKVWCATDRNSALTAAKLDQSFETHSCDASVIQDNYLLGQEIGLSGTPAIVLEDGRLIGGYLPADALQQQIEHSEPQVQR
ncbi:MAG TPA: DsbC family protein [Woeseiaceae bacterium]|nr:DsbC family protein [Woeseiaceae bacterium]